MVKLNIESRKNINQSIFKHTFSELYTLAFLKISIDRNSGKRTRKYCQET